jgi:glycosyltransferase involved in cell wall biosynthesis
VVCTFEDGPVRGDLERMGVRVEVLGLRRHGVEALPRFVAEMASIRGKLVRLVRAHEIDIVQTHLLQTLDFLTLTLRRGTGLAGVIWTIHNVEFLPEGDRGWSAWKRSAHRLLYRRTAGKASRIVAVSDEVRASVLSQIGPVGDRIRTIRNGVDPRRYEAGGDRALLGREIDVDPTSPLLLTVGRLTEQKGHRYLLEAAVQVLRSRPDACLLLVGEGELRESLADSARRAGIADRVRFLGVRDDVPRLLASTDVFVLPSVWEGLSVALLEAMAAAKPIVATDVSGTREAMVPGETGEVVPPRDAGALARAIERLLADPERGRVLGHAARERVTECFGARKQAAEYLALYREVLTSN